MKTLNETAPAQNDIIACGEMELLEMEGDVSDSYLAELTHRALVAQHIQLLETAVYGAIN